MIMASPDSSTESSDHTPHPENLSFQGFLRKRKDTMKFAWSKYWFKLQNTTLYFYTDKDSQETSLRGQYYMYSVQSVRTVSSADGDFTFEIVMKSGKRKLLSAESADLRDVWIKLLWKAMQLPGPGRHNSSCTWYDIPELIQSVSCSSADSQPITAIDDNILMDDVVKSPLGAAQTDESDGHSGPDAVYDVPNFLCAGEHSFSGFAIYDVPRPQAKNPTLHSECGVAAVEEEPQYTSLSHLRLYDNLLLSSADTEVSGLALKAITDGTDIPSSVCVLETLAEESSS